MEELSVKPLYLKAHFKSLIINLILLGIKYIIKITNLMKTTLAEVLITSVPIRRGSQVTFRARYVFLFNVSMILSALQSLKHNYYYYFFFFC